MPASLLVIVPLIFLTRFLISNRRKRGKSNPNMKFYRIPKYIEVLVLLAILDWVFNKNNNMAVHCIFICVAILATTVSYFISRHKANRLSTVKVEKQEPLL